MLLKMYQQLITFCSFCVTFDRVTVLLFLQMAEEELSRKLWQYFEERQILWQTQNSGKVAIAVSQCLLESDW